MEINCKKIVAIIVATLLAMSGLVFIIPQKPLCAQSLEDELEQTKNEREETQEKIKEVTKQEKQYMAQVSETEEQLRVASGELGDLNAKLSNVKSEIDKTTIELVLKKQELQKIEDELEDKVKVLNNRVASIYKNGKSSILEILLNTESFIEFVSRLKLMNVLAVQDGETIQVIKDKKNATLNIKKTIVDLREKEEEHKEKVERLVTQAEQKKSEVDGICGEMKSLLSKTRANKNALIQMEKQLEIRESEINRILESYKYGSAPSGKLMWPVAGRLISGFGYRIHPIFGTRRFHSGIDLAAPYGTLVKAADGGQIIQAGYFGGYGNSIMVYHGGGFATWYAHLSSINVSMGQFVQKGQVIGLVGATGWTTGPHLHFEVRINGNPQNPLGYLQ
jgi:murein DD-endopeptidase MepM/ murein hydrolase activator NlpD